MQEAVITAIQNSPLGMRRHAVSFYRPNPPAVRMDLERIIEVITHLLDNGKILPPDTPIHVTVELHDSRSSPALRIMVRGSTSWNRR